MEVFSRIKLIFRELPGWLQVYFPREQKTGHRKNWKKRQSSLGQISICMPDGKRCRLMQVLFPGILIKPWPCLKRSFLNHAGTQLSLQWHKIVRKIVLFRHRLSPEVLPACYLIKLLYGTDNIFGYNLRGTVESIDKITMNDLKNYYDKNFSPSVSKILVAGNVSKEQVLAALKPFETEWKAKEVKLKFLSSSSKSGEISDLFC